MITSDDADGGGGAPARSAPRLRLRPLRPADETAFVIAHWAMAADAFTFGLGYQPGMEWSSYLEALENERLGVNLPPGIVPATFLVADVAQEIVGRVSVRHTLNDFLAREGGHIGYGVLPGHRRRGYATEILRQGLVIARANGVDRVLVTCDDSNTGSAAVIEACGGRLDSVVQATTGAYLMRRYWIG
jgi:predicted acetyltransferase